MKTGDIKYVMCADGKRSSIYEVELLLKHTAGNWKVKYVGIILDLVSLYNNYLGIERFFAPAEFYETSEEAIEKLINNPNGISEINIIEKLLR